MCESVAGVRVWQGPCQSEEHEYNDNDDDKEEKMEDE